MTLTESLVSSFLLMLLAGQSGRVFTQSMKAAGDMQVRDQVALSISRDLETVRNTVNLWQVDEGNLDANDLPKNGEMAYQPIAAMCEDNTLAVDLIKDSEAMGDDAGSLVEDSTTTRRVKDDIPVGETGLSLIRTISSDSGNENLLKVHYAISGNVLQYSDQSTTLVMPAQAWCP